MKKTSNDGILLTRNDAKMLAAIPYVVGSDLTSFWSRAARPEAVCLLPPCAIHAATEPTTYLYMNRAIM